MKVYEFMAVITGSRRICFSHEKTPMTANEFWKKYRLTERWAAEIDEVHMVAKEIPKANYFTECTIRLKK